MRFVLFAVLFFMLLLRMCNQLGIAGLQLNYQNETERGRVLSLVFVQVKDTTSLWLTAASNGLSVALKRRACLNEKAEVAAPANTASSAADLTLEYMAVQLPRSQSMQK